MIIAISVDTTTLFYWAAIWDGLQLPKMKLAKRLAGCLAIFILLESTRTWAFPQFTREEEGEDTTEDATEEEDEDVDDVYDEEAAATASNVVEPEEEDKDDKEDRLAREKIAQRLGIQNFSSAALADKATALVVTYLAARYPQLPSPRPRKKVKPTEPVAITTKKYKIYKTTTSNPNSSPQLVPKLAPDQENVTNTMRTFVITVPRGMNGTGGGTIEINIPMPMTLPHMPMPLNHHTHMSIRSPDDQGVKNIEAAIMEALLIAQQMTTMTLSTTSSNNTETFELDIGDLKKTPENEEEEITPETIVVNATTDSTASNLTSASPEPQKDIDSSPFESPIELPEYPTTAKPKRKRRTTKAPVLLVPTPDDPYIVGPVTDVIVSQIRSGQLPQFLWGSIMKLAKSKYAEIAVDAVECAVFYYCPDDTELGTLTKGGKF